jgi:hypothetical protein
MNTQMHSRAGIPTDQNNESDGRVIVADRPTSDRSLLRIAAVAIPVGIVLQIGMEALHPSKADPNDSAAAFQEYAASNTWTIVHIGQFFAALLVALALVTLARSLARQGGGAGALAVIGGVTAILVAAVFAVQMAVDGVALKATIDTWMNAVQAGDKASAYQVAEGMRALEKGLSGFFHLVNGTTFLALGLAIAFGRSYPRWLGWVGAVAGLGFLAGGVVAANTGFSALAGTVLLGPTVLGAIFLIGAAVCMWRGSTTARSSGRAF